MRHPSLPVAAELFGEGWSRIKGGGLGAGPAVRPAAAALGRAGQMARAARGARPAVFKAIRGGGCHTGAQLRTQLAYLCTKSSLIFDARGTFDGQAVLAPAEIDAVARRFEGRWEAGRHPRLGHTSHLLMSFPVGTPLDRVAGVARDVCERFFQGEGARFDYVVAVHEDRAHRHAHVVLNRQSPDGEVFYLREGHRFSYGLFREAMVEHGERHGVRLEATRRLDRGVLAYAARTGDVHRAREEGQAVVERARAGAALDHGRREVELAASTYRGLALAAKADGLGVVQAALGRAGLALDRGEAVAGAREALGARPYLADWQTFEGQLRELAAGVGGVEARIARAAPTERPRLEAGLYEALGSVAALNPLGRGSGALREPAREDGFYGREGLERSPVVGLGDARVGTRVEAALQGTGIDANEVLARLAVGAPSAALERLWLAGDVRAVGERDGLDLGREADVERALDRLDAVQTRLAQALTAGGREVMAEALRREEEADRRAAREAEVRRIEQERERERGREAAERARLAEQEARAARERTRLAEVAREARAAEAEVIAAVLERGSWRSATDPAFADRGQAQAFRAALERRLGPTELARLARGDETAAAGLVEGLAAELGGGRGHGLGGPGRPAADRLDRLVLAKACMESVGAPERSDAHRRVVLAVAHAQIDAKREREGPGHGDDWVH